MSQYRFSPITDKEQLIQAVRYVVIETSRLAEKIVGQKYPIKYLTVFSHFDDEFENLKIILGGMGSPYDENNGPRVTLHEPIHEYGNKIVRLRIRKPDLERPQVGCADFETNYISFKEHVLEYHPNNLRLILRSKYEMIEFFDPECDVLAYIVSDT